MSSYYPILFSGPMVRAILEGRKTVTRRVFPTRAEVGDILWVRETWAKGVPGCAAQGGYIYRADHIHPDGDGPERIKWRPSIHMPRDASRITLEVVDVRIQTLSMIGNIEEEGFSSFDAFQRAWNAMYARRGMGWNDNPMVQVVRFKRVEG